MPSGSPWKASTERRPSSGRARGATFIRPMVNWPLATTSPARRSSTAVWSTSRRAGLERVAASPPRAAANLPPRAAHWGTVAAGAQAPRAPGRPPGGGAELGGVGEPPDPAGAVRPPPAGPADVGVEQVGPEQVAGHLGRVVGQAEGGRQVLAAEGRQAPAGGP